MRRRVIKVGGSLLRYPDLVDRFDQWRTRQEPADQTCVIVGGGTIVDQIRLWDQRFELAPHTVHWMAIRAMRLTAELFCALDSTAKIVESPDKLAGQGVFVIDPGPFLCQAERQLPCGWDVTSDSIAAFIASDLKAEELVLLKSIPYEFQTLEEAVDHGYVDPYFIQASRTCANVRFDVL